MCKGHSKCLLMILLLKGTNEKTNAFSPVSCRSQTFKPQGLIYTNTLRLTCISHYSSKSALLAIDQGDDYGDLDINDSNDKRLVDKAILSLAIPALAGLAIDPLMTLTDTAFIGRTAEDSTALAGVGSAASLLTFSFYLFNFLCTVTTPLVSKKRAASDDIGATEIGGQALSLAIFLGVLLSTILVTYSHPLLLLMGTENTGVVATSYATSFLTIRAIAAPAIFISSASTGILRGYLDTKTAFVLIASANVINFVLDVILIGMMHMGPSGAAIATTAAEWTCALSFLFILAGKAPSAEGKLGSNQTELKRIIVTPTLVLPSWENIRPLITASSSVFVRSFMLQLSIVGAAAAAARNTDTLSLLTENGASASIAAHQIALQLWLLCSFICDSLAAASQALIADGLGKRDQKYVRTVSKTIFTYSFILGIILAGILEIGNVSGVLLNFFTTDEATHESLKPLLLILIIAQPLNSFVFAADGVIQGSSEFEYQATSMILSVTVAVLSFFTLQYLDPSSATLIHTWYGLIILQLMRGVTSVIKIVDPEGPIDYLAKNVNQ